MVNFEEIQEVIKNRRSIYPKSYLQKPIEKEVLLSLLECANQAPTHRLTQPWRFKIFRDAGLMRLADELVRQYEETTPVESFLQRKSDSIHEKVMQSGAVLAICMHVSGKVPEWEEIAAVACSVQNIWIAASTMGIGSYWSSPGLIVNLNSFLKLEDNEKCLGLFYMGYHKEQTGLGSRTPIEEKISWVEK
jgi:nitroreductase